LDVCFRNSEDEIVNSCGKVVALRRQEELTAAPLPLRRCQTMPDARPKKEYFATNNGSSTDDEPLLGKHKKLEYAHVRQDVPHKEPSACTSGERGKHYY